MITLSITGAMYPFRDEIDNWYHSDLKRVAGADRAGRLGAGRDAGYGGEIYRSHRCRGIDRDYCQHRSRQDGGLCEPYNGLVLGAMPDRSTLMWTVRTLHSRKYFGTCARYIIEIAAGWSILLVGTGVYL